MILKVCGTRDEENIRQLEQLDIDWMGFIFYPGSPRYVGKKVSYLSSKIKKAGVFVDQDPQVIRETAKQNHLDLIQLHGTEPPWYCINLREEGFKVIKAFGVPAGEQLPHAQLDAYKGKCDYFLFDTKTVAPGGSGKKFNWEVLETYQGETPFILSGGISPEDAERVKHVEHPKFAGIDINSRFEIAPGMKDVESIKNFIKQLR